MSLFNANSKQSHNEVLPFSQLNAKCQAWESKKPTVLSTLQIGNKININYASWNIKNKTENWDVQIVI